MTLDEIDARLYRRAHLHARLWWLAPALAFPVWIVCLYLIDVAGALPRLAMPLPTVLLFVLTVVAAARVRDRRILHLLDRYIDNDPEARASVAQRSTRLSASGGEE